MNKENSFFNLLAEIKEFGAIKSPDFIAYVIPLLTQIKNIHEQNKTAHMSDISQIDYTQYLALNTPGKAIQENRKALFKKVKNKNVLHVSETLQEEVEVGSFDKKYTNLAVHTDLEKPIAEPVYIIHYKTWELEQKHCDPLTDIFSLGQILASVAFGLDFRKAEDLELFVSNRNRLYFLNKQLHPTILNVIFEMTHLYREDRTQNLLEVITKLNNYREYKPENYVDLSEAVGFKNIDISDRSSWILTKLKNRLFDISRRNKLLYFRENASFMNLTVSSFPILLDHKNVRENDLIYWNEALQSKIIGSKKLNLNSYLEFQHNSFLAPQLNKIRLDARKSKNEYGFSPLKLVIAYLHWYNFKEDGEEKITSPLLLLPTELTKKKAVNDIYTLNFESAEAEINPILSNYLKDLYDIELPDFIFLEEKSIAELIESIQKQIAEGGTGIMLEWHQQPRIQLIHKIAKKNFHLKNRKLQNRARNLNLRSFNYSYQEEEFKPLGLQIFNERVRPKKSELEYIINGDIKSLNNAVGQKERTFYTNNNQGEINPLVWEIDTCNITLGNFNYRKMSLVKDYNDIVQSKTSNTIFEKLFDENPKTIKLEDNESFKFENNFPIISADPTQTASILFARTGANYIIQGPPGTGKSQTITNLIADYIARDKKILFVCEKRAALDVVFHRLKNRNLDELCCLIHDSQTDKKAFIQNLKKTYESFIEEKIDSQSVNLERQQIIKQLNAEIASIQYFHRLMKAGETAPLELLQVLHKTKKEKPFPSANETIYFPSYDEWKKHKTWISEWINQLNKNQLSPYVSSYVFAQIADEILDHSNPKAEILERSEKIINLLDQFSEFIDNSNSKHIKNLGEWKQNFDLANKIQGIFRENKLEIFNEFSTDFRALEIAHNDLENTKKEILKKEKTNKNWINKYSETDNKEALNQWNNLNSSFLKYFKPSYYALKNKIQADYDFDAHQIKPSISKVLENLIEEYEIKTQLLTKTKKQEKIFGLKHFETDFEWVKSLHKSPNTILKNWLENKQQSFIKSLYETDHIFEQLFELSSSIFGNLKKINLTELESKIQSAKKDIHSLSAFVPYLKQKDLLSPEMQNLLYEKQWTLEDFEFHLAYKSLQDIYEKERPFAEIDENRLHYNIRKINQLLSKYYEQNVESIRSKIRDQFLEKIRITESVAAQLTAEEKVLKKKYNAGRRILENEFGKSMRYKSIRDLATGEANEMMTSIKPVWLMSPLSVSDTMPLDHNMFDVVIYDEASQITVEEGVPALFRTKQTIIVGDEMQMPPTNFFSTNSIVDEAEEETEKTIGISLDADSLLNQGARKLSSVMLGWHYRSRRESLISFSNAAFYERSLLTIPDCKIHQEKNTTFDAVEDIYEHIDIEKILDKSISFQYIENAVYDKRKNKDEANYIANLVSQILKSKVGKSIGIVAFSMSQQGEIEEALERLAYKDDVFETLLEQEYQREDEDSFNGLFVKNLENVQGDERDIIIMSVCYGHNTSGRLLMNFGPINRKGGEKRLNVIFSRAKQNMVVVSSMMPHEIRNDYNVGANYFKKFLSYAKNISEGKIEDANLILDGLSQYKDSINDQTSILGKQIATEIEKLGFSIDFNVGQSHFKCHLAIKKPQESHYKLGILLDLNLHYENENILEQYCQKPEILKAFGWQIMSVYSKDWLEKPESVILKIKQNLTENFKAKTLEIETIKIEENPRKEEKTIEEKIEEPLVDLGFERYEFTEGTSYKFWQIKIDKTTLTVEYGRIGNKAQTNIKQFENEQIAAIAKDKMIATKVAKGYLKLE